ncbi:MAG: hypothetical protein L6Q37_05680 [Bdellovibrionaceae bacterium]|nr:hypothetical protein [Pseudobdellovibrionaceae bacterium]NUM57858.1 hypothetical protein [Pseudobdellovibrionaceae bacterium]
MLHKFKVYLLLLLLFSLQTRVNAQNPGSQEPNTVTPISTSTGSKSVTATLPTEPANSNTNREFNFEGDVIEAQKNKPILILDSQDVGLDIEDIIYNRTNFDEYFQIEKNNKPQFAK